MVLFAAAAFILTACSGLQEDGGEKNIRINLPPIVSASGNSRALSGDRLPTLKTETRRYRVTVNGIVREGTGSSYEFRLAVGIRATAIIECLNSSGEVIIRAVKDFTVSGGENSIDINLKADGNEIIPSPPTSTKSAVSYELDGGDWSSTSAPPQTEEYDEGATVTITTNVPTKPSFTFLGWKSSVSSLIPSGGGDNFQSGSTFAMPSSAVTFTAQWTNKPVHDVIYDLGFQPSGGSQTSTVQVAEDASVSLAAPSAERKGYTFKQWLYNGTAAPSDLKMSTGNITLTAEWNVIPYSITYDANGGGSNPGNTTFNIETANVSFASSASLLKQGYSFANWETTGGQDVSSMTNPADLINLMGNGTTLALRAKWQEMTELNVSASGNDTTGDGSTAKPFATVQKAIDITQTLTGTNLTIKVNGTIEVSEEITFSAKSKTITLTGTNNGTLKRAPSASAYTDYFMSVIGEVTLQDITLDGNKDESVTSSNPFILVSRNCVVTMESGTVIQNHKTIGGNVGTVEVSGQFIMNGGTIQNNELITTNSACGGVRIEDGGKFEMYGGSITNNKAECTDTFGRAVVGAIAGSGSAICIIAGGSITYNESKSAAVGDSPYGGMYGSSHNDGQFIIGSTDPSKNNTITIKENKGTDNAEHNLFYMGYLIEIVAEPATGSQIGITPNNGTTGVFTSGWQSSWDKGVFTSDDTSKTIDVDADTGELKVQ